MIEYGIRLWTDEPQQGYWFCDTEGMIFHTNNIGMARAQLTKTNNWLDAIASGMYCGLRAFGPSGEPMEPEETHE